MPPHRADESGGSRTGQRPPRESRVLQPRRGTVRDREGLGSQGQQRPALPPAGRPGSHVSSVRLRSPGSRGGTKALGEPARHTRARIPTLQPPHYGCPGVRDRTDLSSVSRLRADGQQLTKGPSLVPATLPLRNGVLGRIQSTVKTRRSKQSCLEDKIHARPPACPSGATGHLTL